METRIFTEQAVVELLASHTYDQVRELTGWSRGRIYQAACKLSARKNEAKIMARHAHLREMQEQFLKSVTEQTATMDVLDYLAGLPDNAVSLFLSSPPYNLGKGYGEGGRIDSVRFGVYYGWLVQVVSEMARVLKPGGTLCLQVGQTRDWQHDAMYPIDVLIFEDLRRAGLTFVSRVAWTFNHGLTPKRRLTERYETMLVFSKGEQDVFNPNAARTPQQDPGKRAFKGPNIGKLSGHPFGAAPSNVWEIPSIGANSAEKTDHPCQFPLALARRAVLLWSLPGQTVSDPFHGSGTTHQACIETGRGFTGCDLNYQRTRNQRLARAMPDLVSALPGVTDESVAVWQAQASPVHVPPRTVDQQLEMDLFAETF